MNKGIYKETFDNLKVDDDTVNKVKVIIKRDKAGNNAYISKKYISIFASIVLVLGITIISAMFVNNNKIAGIDKGITDIQIVEEGISIPKIELPNNSRANVKMDMIGLIVYQDRIYTQTGTSIETHRAPDLLGDKIGRTRGNIDEWSNQDDYAVEFASTIGKEDVYTVKGYDKNFRIMTYSKSNNETYAQFYECLNGIIVENGDDIFSKLKIEGNINIIKYEDFDSWNENKQQYKKINSDEAIKNFVKELKFTIPYTQKSLQYLFSKSNSENTKFLYLTLNDGCEVALRIFEEGYVYYNSSHIFFQMDSETFRKIWEKLCVE